MLRRALLATLLVSAPVLYAKERILLHRIGPSQSTLFIANADGSNERPLLPNSSFDYNASLSADGKWIVFTSERGGSADIYRVHPDGSGLERLTDDPAYDDQGALSPDGKRLAFVSSRGTGSADIWVLDLQTKKAQNLSHAPGSFRPSWSPDGKWIAFSSDRNTPVRRDGGRFEQSHDVSIYLMRADGTDVRRLTPAGKFAGSPKWSPDGERIVFYEMDIQDTFYARRASPVVGSGKLVDSQIVSVSIANGTRQEHTSGPGLKVSPQFLSGNRIGYVMKAGPRMGLVFTTGDQGAEGQMRNPSWSRDGKRVVYQKWSSEPWRQNEPLFSIDPEFDLAQSDPFPAFSHDGKKLAVTYLGKVPRSRMSSLSVMDADGTNAKQIFRGEEGTLALAPQWSPKDEWIAFGVGFYFAPRSGRPARVMLMRPDGSEPHELTKTAGNSGFPSWSPDGKRIVYRFWSETAYGLRIMNLDDGSSTHLTSGFDNFPAWSPKGDLIAFTRLSEDDYDIYTIRPDGTDLKRLTTTPGNDAHAVWSPDGEHILFSSARLGFKDEAPLSDDVPQPYGELFVMNADGSNQRPLTDNQWEDATPAWAPLATVALAQTPSLSKVANARERTEVQLTYLGNAGWQITDGKTFVLVDPYITQFRHPPAPATTGQPTDPQTIIAPDTEEIDAKIRRADYILVTHGHLDHALDAPYIAKKTGAMVIGNETVANLARAYDVPDVQLIVVRGGEDYAFGAFSLKVIPTIHSALFRKHYFSSRLAGNAPPGLKAPLKAGDFVEGQSVAYLLRLAGHGVLAMGSMNYIEREMEGLRPDIALVGANNERLEIYDYTRRLMGALGNPLVVMPTHWDAYGYTPLRDQSLAAAHEFADEVMAASPKTRVIIPQYFEPIRVP